MQHKHLRNIEELEAAALAEDEQYKRIFYEAMAFHALLSHGHNGPQQVAETAIRYADALMRAQAERCES